MVLPKFDYYSPLSLADALKYLSENEGKGVKILAGGTDLLVDLRSKVIPDHHRARCQQHQGTNVRFDINKPEPVKVLMGMSRIDGLRGITQKGSTIRIGAMTTISDLERSDIIREQLPALWDGARSLGSPLVRNRGTFGGNICNARPAADTAVPALAHGAKLVLANSRGARIVEHEDFVTGPGKTIIKPDEILTAILFHVPNNSSGAYFKLANRKALEISVVGAAVSLAYDKDGIVTQARIALGAVAPKPLLITEAAKALIGKKLNSESIAEAALIAEQTAKPITDHRGTKDYRSAMVEVLVRRAIEKSQQRLEAVIGQEVTV